MLFFSFITLPLDTINETFGLNINMSFLDHHSLKLKLKDFLEFQDKPLTLTLNPKLHRNSSIYIQLNIDIRGA